LRYTELDGVRRVSLGLRGSRHRGSEEAALVDGVGLWRGSCLLEFDVVHRRDYFVVWLCHTALRRISGASMSV
jgi:hypothetical protein